MRELVDTLSILIERVTLDGIDIEVSGGGSC